MFNVPPTQFAIYVFSIVFFYGGYRILKEKNYLNTLDRKLLILTLLIIFGIYLYEVLVLNTINISNFLFILLLLFASAYIGIKDGKNLLEIQTSLTSSKIGLIEGLTEEKFESIKTPVINLIQNYIDEYSSLGKLDIKNNLIIFKNKLDISFDDVIKTPDGILNYQNDLKELLNYFTVLKNNI